MKGSLLASARTRQEIFDGTGHLTILCSVAPTERVQCVADLARESEQRDERPGTGLQLPVVHLVGPGGQQLRLGVGRVAAAGKSLSARNPSALRAIASEAVAPPGKNGTGARVPALSSSGVARGLTRKRAPAAAPFSICPAETTVSAPTTASGTSLAIAVMAASTLGMRNVTSIARNPPAIRSFACL